MFGRDRKVQEITISNKTILRIIGFILGAVLIISVFNQLVHPLTLIFVAFFLAIALNPTVTFVSSKLKNKSRAKGTAIAYVTVIIALSAFLSVVVPPLVKQTTQFIQDVPQTLRSIKDDTGTVGDFVRRYELESQVTDLANNWAKNLSGVQGPIVSTANRIISNLVSIITVLILTFMMLVEGPKWLEIFWKEYPDDRRVHAKKMAHKMYNVVTGYVNGQVLVAAIGASFSIIAIIIASTIFNATSVNAVALGGIVFLFSLIPTIGAILSSAVVVLFSLFVSPPLAITMLIYFIVYQQIENATIQPYIQSRGNELTPMLVFISAILGLSFGGIFGAFVAIPLAAIIKLLVDDRLQIREIGKNSNSNPSSKS